MKKIPRIYRPPNQSAGSTERALKQVKRLLEEHCDPDGDPWAEDALWASIDDVTGMLECLE